MIRSIINNDSVLMLKSTSEIVSDKAVKSTIQPMLEFSKFESFDKFLNHLINEQFLEQYSKIYLRLTDLGINKFRVIKEERFIRKDKLNYLYTVCLLDLEMKLENQALSNKVFEFKIAVIGLVGMLIGLYFMI